MKQISVKLRRTSIFSVLSVIFLAIFIVVPSYVVLAHPDPTGIEWEDPDVSYDFSTLSTSWKIEVAAAGYTWHSEADNFLFYNDPSSINDWYAIDLGVGYSVGYTLWDQEDNYFTQVDSYFNTYYDFDIDDDVDVQTVALHEFGHWLQLGDISQLQIWHQYKVMYELYLWVKQELDPADIAGLLEIYPD